MSQQEKVNISVSGHDTTSVGSGVDESRTAKFLRIASSSTLEQFLSGCNKNVIKSICTELMDEVPPGTDRRCLQAVLTIAKSFYDAEFKHFMDNNELDEKLKILEKITEETKDRKKKSAWRPTGLSASEQQKSCDLAVKKAKLVSLVALVAAKEKKVKELQEKVTAKRAPAKILKQSVGDLMTFAASEYEASQNVTDTMLSFLNES